MSTGSIDTVSTPRVLVPLDGSPFSEYVLPLAARIASLQGAEIDLARAHLPMAVVYAPGEFSAPIHEPDWDRQTRSASRVYLEERAARLKSEFGVNARPVLVDGRAARAIGDHVREEGVTFVVTTSHGRGGLSRIVQGSVVDELVRLVDVPVLTVRPPDDFASQPPPEELSRLLVPLDGSDTAARVLVPAGELAELTGASILLLHVVTPSTQARAVTRPPADQVGDPATDPLAAEGMEMLEAAAAPLRSRGITVNCRVKVAADPAACILSEADREGADCIAIATHGRGGFTRMLFGSVADRVFRGAVGAVLLLRAEPVEQPGMEAVTKEQDSV